MASRNNSSDEETELGAPATTPEARERQIVALTMDLAEKQIREGTASSQVMTHFLKVGSTQAQVDLERARLEQLKIEAQIAELNSRTRAEDMLGEVMVAIRSYQPSGDDEIA